MTTLPSDVVRKLHELELQQRRTAQRPERTTVSSWGSLHSAISGLLGLRGHWPMGPINTSGNPLDVSAHVKNLTNVGAPDYTSQAGGLPAVLLNGSTQCLYHADDPVFDISGTEFYIDPSRRGITIGALAYFDTLAVYDVVIGKRANTAASTAYGLYKDNSGIVTFVLGDGATQKYASSGIAASISEWHWVAGTADAANNLAYVWLDESYWTVGIAALANILNNAYKFTVGAWEDGAGGYTLHCDGAISNPFVTCAFTPIYTMAKLARIALEAARRER